MFLWLHLETRKQSLKILIMLSSIIGTIPHRFPLLKSYTDSHFILHLPIIIQKPKNDWA